jgi:hypothetical protein
LKVAPRITRIFHGAFANLQSYYGRVLARLK